MAGVFCVMEYRSNQFQYGVGEAIRLVTDWIAAIEGKSGGTQPAIRTVAKDCRITVAQVRRLSQPSRRPKGIDLGVWQRLRDGYARWLRKQLRLLETELHRIEAMGNMDPRTRDDLAREVETLARRIKQHL